jgi:hypothetical protein
MSCVLWAGSIGCRHPRQPLHALPGKIGARRGVETLWCAWVLGDLPAHANGPGRGVRGRVAVLHGGETPNQSVNALCPRQDSNLRHPLRGGWDRILARGCLALPRGAVSPGQNRTASHLIRLMPPCIGQSAHASLTRRRLPSSAWSDLAEVDLHREGGRCLEDAGEHVSVPVGLRRGVENVGVLERNACRGHAGRHAGRTPPSSSSAGAEAPRRQAEGSAA